MNSTAVIPTKIPDSTPHRRQPRFRWAMAAAVAAVVFLIGSFLVALDAGRTSEQERDAAASQAVAAADPVRELCAEATPVGAALRADPRNPCGLAAQVLAEPIPTPTAVPRDAPEITPEQIQTAVAAELARNPPEDGRTPSLAEVTAIVARLLTDDPSQIAAQVALYVEQNPIRDGRDGRDGEDAPEITPAQIREAVVAELAANPPLPGAQGIGVTAVRIEPTEDGCALVFTLTNPADGSTAEQSVPVPDDFCTDPPVIEIE